MKNLFRAFVSSLAAVLISGMLPQPGICMVTQKIMVSCSMPCCKSTPSKAAQCPLIRQAPARDTIASSAIRISPDFTVAAISALRDFVSPVTPSAVLEQTLPIPKFAFSSTPQSVPAPPASLA